MPEMESVVSSSVASIGYDEGNEDIYVEFNSGDTYVYMGAPMPVWEDFQASDSKGRFVNHTLKANYPYRKL